MGPIKRIIAFVSTLVVSLSACASDQPRWSNPNNTSSYPAPYSEQNNPVSIDIIDDRGQTFGKHQHRNNYKNHRAYVEARKGANYKIRVRNRSNKRIAVVIAVDGRNIISGKKSYLKNNERMYVLGPHQSATYKGWRTGQNKVNRFFFTDAGNSYSASWGDHSAMGVIAAAVYREIPRYESQTDYYKKSSKARRGTMAAEDAGTGFGHEEHSASRKVEFEAEKHHSGQYFFKYEWRNTLCQRGVLNCHNNHYNSGGNRFWPNNISDNSAYAPYPPSYRK
ncbi:MAG: Unknown protein [uncultured Thiotrichaceae bacterium]|uniref:Uncharacterized protein n=1 Tax=uncultured Thiotrichaceae bacterium TaxID=298394 RepID=A0A6S6SFW2_9GAMM|nr:MAG: Unknown protein [uncultured Thiotrichaceae bacterium]